MLDKFLVVIYTTILLFSPSPVIAARNKNIGLSEDKRPFLPLFNGKDLAGWSGDPAFWSIRDGHIVAQVAPETEVKNHSYLIWQGGKLRDFELQVMVRSTQGNSGIDYRAEHVPVDKNGEQLKWTIKGYQSDVAAGWMGSLYNWGKPGVQPSQFVIVTGEKPDDKYVGEIVNKETLDGTDYYKSGQWNQFTIIARGSHILHRINGYPVIEFIDNSSLARKEGILGLQVHAGKKPFFNEFKDISIKQLYTNFGDASLLLNRNNLSGWVFPNTGTKDAWIIENGELVTQANSTNYICTHNKYTNYVLRFQYRRANNNEAAVLLRLSDSNKGIRISGKTEDFNRIEPLGGFQLKQIQHSNKHTAFRKMPAGFWNECEIILKKGELSLQVNNIPRAAAVNCEQITGRIGFENSNGRAEYRNIVLIPILPE